MTWTGGNDVPRPRIWGIDGVELTALAPSFPRHSRTPDVIPAKAGIYGYDRQGRM